MAWSDTPLEETEIGIRTYNILKGVNINTLGQLAMKSDAELMQVPGLGQSAVRDIRNVVRVSQREGPLPPLPVG